MAAPGLFWLGFSFVLILGVIPRIKYVKQSPRLKALIDRAGRYVGLLLMAAFALSMAYVFIVGFPE